MLGLLLWFAGQYGAVAAAQATKQAPNPTSGQSSEKKGGVAQPGKVPEVADAQTGGAREGETPRSMDTLLDDAVSEQLPTPAAAAAAKRKSGRKQPALPETPSTDGLRSAVKVLLPAVRGCAMGGRGRIDMVVVLRSDGTVVSAKVAGPPYAGTAGGRCMEGALLKARFPAFSKPRVRLRIPFMIR